MDVTSLLKMLAFRPSRLPGPERFANPSKDSVLSVELRGYCGPLKRLGAGTAADTLLHIADQFSGYLNGFYYYREKFEPYAENEAQREFVRAIQEWEELR